MSKAEYAAAIATEINDARIAAGLTQDELAARMGVSQGAISSWERGASSPNSYSLRRMRALFRELRAVAPAGVQG